MKYIKNFELVKNQSEIDNKLAIGVHRNSINLVIDAIKDGANPNRLDTSGIFLLITAVMNNNQEIVEELLKAGADPNCKGKVGDTPLMYASNALKYISHNKNSGKNIIEELIKYGADWGIKSDNNYYFLDFLSEDYKNFLINKYPEKYKEYLISKTSQKYNM